MIRLAAGNWQDVDGYAVAHGMPDLRSLPLDRLINFIWWLWTRDGSEQDRAKFKARLWVPPKGVVVTDAKSPWSAENETRALASLKAGLGLPSGRASKAGVTPR